jgi:hypothetical protein
VRLEGLGLFAVLLLIINLQLVRENYEEVCVMNVCKTSEISKKLYHLFTTNPEHNYCF